MAKSSQKSTGKKSKKKKEICGIVMPISEIGGLDENHWRQVRDVIEEAAKKEKFEPRMVSESDEVTIIHESIVRNLYENPIVVCDVSCCNPNVMFELGMRLTFDKPVVIIKDDKTSISFDIGSIEHVIYPRYLGYKAALKFIKELRSKIKKTLERKQKDPSYSPFLKHYSKLRLTAGEIKTTEITKEDLIIRKIENIEAKIELIERKTDPNPGSINSIWSTLDETRQHNTSHYIRESIYGDAQEIENFFSPLFENNLFVISYHFQPFVQGTGVVLTLEIKSRTLTEQAENIRKFKKMLDLFNQHR